MEKNRVPKLLALYSSPSPIPAVLRLKPSRRTGIGTEEFQKFWLILMKVFHVAAIFNKKLKMPVLCPLRRLQTENRWNRRWRRIECQNFWHSILLHRLFQRVLRLKPSQHYTENRWNRRWRRIECQKFCVI